MLPPPPSDERADEVIEADSKQSLASSDADSLLAGLREKLVADASLKLDLTYRLYRPKAKK